MFFESNSLSSMVLSISNRSLCRHYLGDRNIKAKHAPDAVGIRLFDLFTFHAVGEQR